MIENPVRQRNRDAHGEQGKLVLSHDERAAHVHEHVNDNAKVNLDAHVHGKVDVVVDGSCLITS
jgi:hypothetical protein